MIFAYPSTASEKGFTNRLVLPHFNFQLPLSLLKLPAYLVL